MSFLACILILALQLCSGERTSIRRERYNASRTSEPPPFDPEPIGQLMSAFVQAPVQECGTEIEAKVRLSASSNGDIVNSPETYLRVEDTGSEKRHIVAAAGWANLPRQPGALAVMEGHSLVSIGDLDVATISDLAEVVRLLRDNADTELELTFSLGLDLRSCWGDLHDMTDREVCSQDTMVDLVADIAKTQPKFDDLGKGGATVVTNLRGFVIKSVADDEEYDTMKAAMPGFGEEIQKQSRKYGGCYSTALAPICLVVQVPIKTETETKITRWMAMRKIEIPDTDKAQIDLEGDKISIQDLKGPKFANSLRDGKTFFSEGNVWKQKDAGFVNMFPNGLTLRGCGSRGASYVLELDSQMLASSQMTDYSLFSVLYKQPDDYSCVCETASGHPTWPLILDTEKSGETQPLRMAIGIIDYIERGISSFDKALGFSMSTMKPPSQYQEWWMRMFPSYFHLQRRTLDLQDGVATMKPHDHSPAQIFRTGDRVTALMKMKWIGSSWMSSRLNVLIMPADAGLGNAKGYVRQIHETSSEHSSKGSKYKVLAGDMGTIVHIMPFLSALQGPGIFVEWDKIHMERKRVFMVYPEQILALPDSPGR